jgi:hypothetical protein
MRWSRSRGKNSLRTRLGGGLESSYIHACPVGRLEESPVSIVYSRVINLPDRHPYGGLLVRSHLQDRRVS